MSRGKEENTGRGGEWKVEKVRKVSGDEFAEKRSGCIKRIKGKGTIRK